MASEELDLITKVAPHLLTALPKIYGILQQAVKKIITEADFNLFFENYYNRSYTKMYYANTMLAPNTRVPLDKIFLPLTLVSAQKKEKNKYLIHNFPQDLLESYDRILIRDSAGMGKSTILRRIFLTGIDVIDQNINTSTKLPVLIDLRKIQSFEAFDKLVKFEIIEGKPEYEVILIKLLEQGKFLFLFDGFDEIPKELYETSMDQLKLFTEKYHLNKFIITSRDEPMLNSLGSFQGFHIKRLQRPEIHTLIRKCGSCLLDFQSDTLIKELNSSTNSHLYTLLTNPMLVTLLVVAYDYKKRIPLKMTDYFDQVFDALFEKHDLTKQTSFDRTKCSGLGKSEFSTILRNMAIISLTKYDGKIEYSQTEIQKIIQLSKEISGKTFKDNDFLSDILSAVPIFRKEGTNFIWAHKSFQDFYAATWLALCKHEKVEAVKKQIFEKVGANFNLLVLYSELDEMDIGQNLFYPFLRDFVGHYNEQSKIPLFKGIPPHIADGAIFLSFFGEYWIQANFKKLGNSDTDNVVFETVRTKTEGTSSEYICRSKSIEMAAKLDNRRKELLDLVNASKLPVGKQRPYSSTLFEKIEYSSPEARIVNSDFFANSEDENLNEAVIRHATHGAFSNHELDIKLCERWLAIFSEKLDRMKSADIF